MRKISYWFVAFMVLMVAVSCADYDEGIDILSLMCSWSSPLPMMEHITDCVLNCRMGWQVPSSTVRMLLV